MTHASTSALPVSECQERDDAWRAGRLVAAVSRRLRRRTRRSEWRADERPPRLRYPA